MSEDGFHVHGVHDHAVEHAAQHGEGGFSGKIAVATAILATLAAIFSYMGGATQSNAALYKNNAAISKTEAANQWAYYQAKSNKQNLAELAAELAPASKSHFDEKVARYEKEKEEIKKTAEGYEAKSKHWDEQSEAELHQHHRFAQAMTALQIAIALAAIALLTRKRWLIWGVSAVSLVGLIVGALAFLHV